MTRMTAKDFDQELLDLYDFYQTKIEDCDRKLEAAVAALTVRADGDVPALPKARTKRRGLLLRKQNFL